MTSAELEPLILNAEAEQAAQVAKEKEAAEGDK